MLGRCTAQWVVSVPLPSNRRRRRCSGCDAGSPHPTTKRPVAVPTSTVLGRGPDAAVLLTSALAYSTGTEFMLSIRVRPRARRRTTPLHQLMHEIGFDEVDANQAFLLGVQFADGRRAMTSGRNGMPASADQDGEQALYLVFGSSTGSDSTLDLKLWLSPLPPAGPVTMVCRWPEFDIGETKVTLDGAAMAAAGSAAIELWPPETSEEPAPEPPTNLLPDDGWFAGQD